MCGIAALVDPTGSTSPGVEERVLDALRHRGPDGDGRFADGPVRLLHTRLAIVDVAGGDQPLYSEDGVCSSIVNGEIYNHLELRTELERLGHRFATRSDSEVVVHGYEEWGTRVVERLNGIFAFAVWDSGRGRLVAARDRYGVKPLYWWSDGQRTAIASEVTPLLATGWVRPEVDRVSLAHYLAWRFVPSPRTMFTGVQKLAPAQTLILEGGRPRIESYDEPPGTPFEDVSPSELEAELATRMTEAVGRHMMSDVPYGAFLSGGVDSAAIVASMRRKDHAAPQTFTIGFGGGGPEFDERSDALESATMLGCRHHATEMVESDFVGEVAQCIRRLEEPTGTASAPALFQLSRFTAEHVKVVLSGQGADEPLGGYQRHQAAAALGLIHRAPDAIVGPAVRLADALPRNERAKRAARLLEAPKGRERLLRIFEITSRELQSELFGDARNSREQATAERRDAAGRALDLVADRDPLEQALFLDTHVFLPDNLLIYGDKMSMAWGLEQRVPFLDVELMRFVERIPARLRVSRMRRKWLYKRAMLRLVPAEIVARRKHPFATPYDDWLRSSLGYEIERRYAPGAALSAYLDPAAVGRLVAEHRTGREDHKRVLYCLLEFALWHEAFIESDALAAPAEAAGGTSQPR